MSSRSPFLGMRGRSVQWLGRTPALRAEELLLFTCCDEVYLDHATALARSLDVFSPGGQILIHVINPSADAIVRLQDLRGSLTHTRLHVSIEQIDLSPMDGTARRAYYASARFLRLSELLETLPISMFCVDADSLIVAPIDGNFSDKPKAEVCLVRRTVDDPVAQAHLRVANGSIWIRPTEPARRWLESVAQAIASAFERDEVAWFIDQRIVADQVDAFSPATTILNIKPKYADWTFRADAILWAGKGDRKADDLRFSVLQRLLGDRPAHQCAALRTAHEAFFRSDSPIRHLVHRACARLKPRVALFLPRLDLPWGTAVRPTRVPPMLSADTLDLRLEWARFAALMANAIERKGVLTEIIELPASQIDAERVAAAGADLALVPHHCHLDFPDAGLPVRFYMQEYFRWVFVVDAHGWSAASSEYPFAVERMPAALRPAFDVYRARLLGGTLSSKFAQPEAQSRTDLVASGQLPPTEYIFFPLQVPHDQSIRYFSDWDERTVVTALAKWCRTCGHTLVLKPHPANPKSMVEFETLAAEHGAWWSTAHVHDLLTHAKAVYTINSGVGFEALLHLKPVVTFGRAEYDAVTVHARPEAADLDRAWADIQNEPEDARHLRHADFVDRFLDRWAVDLSRPDSSALRLDELATAIAEDARTHHHERHAGLSPAQPS